MCLQNNLFPISRLPPKDKTTIYKIAMITYVTLREFIYINKIFRQGQQNNGKVIMQLKAHKEVTVV